MLLSESLCAISSKKEYFLLSFILQSYPGLFLHDNTTAPSVPEATPPYVGAEATVEGGGGGESPEETTEGMMPPVDVTDVPEVVTVDDEGEDEEKEEESDYVTDEVEGPKLVTKGNDRNRFFCGGALITAKHILTAAHCVTLSK